MLAINGMPDHIHILIGMKPTCHLSDLVPEIKKSSNTFIKEKNLTPQNLNGKQALEHFPIATQH